MIASVPLLAAALLGRGFQGSWVAPGPFFALYWSGALLAPLLFAPRDRVAPGVILWVFLAAVAVQIGSALGGGGLARSDEQRVTPGERVGAMRFLLPATAVCTLIALAAPLVALVAAGYGLAVFGSVRALVTAAAELSFGRYTETYVPPLLSQAALPFLYAAPTFGGALAAAAKHRRHFLLSAITFLPPLLMTITQTQRLVTIAAMVLWAGSYLATRVLQGRRGLFTPRHIALGLAAAAATVVMVFAAGLARSGEFDLTGLADLADKIQGAVFGYATGFSQWFESSTFDAGAPGLGRSTFAGLFDALGLGQRQLGLFTERVVLWSGVETNIYTWFRPLIEDFTPVGALAVLTGVGVVAGAAHRAVTHGSIGALPVLAAFYATVLLSAYASIWAYNSILAAIVLFGAACVLMARRRRAGRGTVADAPAVSG
jgi:oligosaccharide repeat unit polymerase